MRCENLDVWKRSCRMSVDIYKYFKENKDFGFKDQITRSSLSIASNIAEGMEKNSNKDNLGLQWNKELNEISKMIKSLVKNLKGSIK